MSVQSQSDQVGESDPAVGFMHGLTSDTSSTLTTRLLLAAAVNGTDAITGWLRGAVHRWDLVKVTQRTQLRHTHNTAHSQQGVVQGG